MKTNLLSLCLAASVALSPAFAFAGDEAPEPLTLQQALALKGGKAVIFQPTLMQATDYLRVTHLALGEGKAAAGEQRAVQLVVYSSVPDEAGNHEVLHNDFHELGEANSPVLSFRAYTPGSAPSLVEGDSRRGVIAVLIGLLKKRNGELVPAVLPKNDAISATIDNGGSPLLLPAVQKVREAASR